MNLPSAQSAPPKRGQTYRTDRAPPKRKGRTTERGGRVSNERRVLAAAAREDGFVDALLEADDGAEDDCMGMALDNLLDQTIESYDRIGEDRGASRERGPFR